jgi:hypothetical protein
MTKAASSAGRGLACAGVICASLVVVGCGGGAPPVAPVATPPISKGSDMPPPKTTAKKSGRGQAIAPGGDLDHRQRRAQMFQEKAETKQ